MYKVSKKKKTAKVRIYVDIFFFALMILVLIPQTTGIPIHEWASFIIIIPFFLHLVINWNWIATNSTKFFQKQPNKTRFDYILNWLLYLFMIIVTVSGIVISESALPLFGIQFKPDRFWSLIHDLSATLFMAIFGIHIALHWRWIVGAISKLKFKSDFHNLTEIRTIITNYSRQLLLIIFISIVLSFVVWIFEYSEWADGFRINSGTNNGENSNNMPKSWMIYILPLLKVAIIITIPAFITGSIVRLKKNSATIKV
ncbi:MAG: DUF4405 domain-containing protein [Bacteroidia bacterium]|nr:DUF4405 domain-containing protein [Bacteroidia bacterium]